ncbi:CMRF35-like molecule 3 isoform X2 [Acipenser oxyrinchus oxyrinchus]|uniref:CMRF35-like molecule 3 isoform X2 n=1 Tax=Acipenser oxyrinchus oxyrinchus TaxID=40147 RepID=A0AAD8LT66_ACIOX|nr:CMRF35-like molecule 3 isoform X2 [Acipenser oxyrinchus oxyrinchus]
MKENKFRPVVQEMKFLILLLVTLPDTAVTSRSITGWEGGSVSIQCDYDQYYKDHEKYWCKRKDWSACIIQRNEDKVSISDNKTQGVFTVTVRRLEKGDEDQYWCAIETMFYDINIPVYLKVADVPVTTTVPVPVSTPTEMSTANETTHDTHRRFTTFIIWVTGGSLFILLVSAVVRTAIVLTNSSERSKEPPRLESDNNKGPVTNSEEHKDNPYVVMSSAKEQLDNNSEELKGDNPYVVMSSAEEQLDNVIQQYNDYIYIYINMFLSFELRMQTVWDLEGVNTYINVFLKKNMQPVNQDGMECIKQYHLHVLGLNNENTIYIYIYPDKS